MPLTEPLNPSRIWLASKSPRRLRLLGEAGYDVHRVESGVDDGGMVQPPDMSPEDWTIHLATLKANGAAHALIQRRINLGLVVGADTVVVLDDDVIGQPRDRDDARRIIERLNDRPHDVVTGVAIFDLNGTTQPSLTYAERATVNVGRISADEIEAYLDSERWHGKAGAYNLAERIAAGWPITHDGDPSCIMGLPMRSLGQHLHRLWNIEAGDENAAC